ncbi:ERAD-associated protein [Tieghemiomyces parasiticus]|uniref:ERAD-associated protein n=1 Tax=Tieghemiomyces parasiticus TaxID=78921 RepID=A0A9W8AHQ2_9FUNG|nr:ERAD-associated protein [Tieghemiomyces parasiticus]
MRACKRQVIVLLGVPWALLAVLSGTVQAAETQGTVAAATTAQESPSSRPNGLTADEIYAEATTILDRYEKRAYPLYAQGRGGSIPTGDGISPFILLPKSVRLAIRQFYATTLAPGLENAQHLWRSALRIGDTASGAEDGSGFDPRRPLTRLHRRDPRLDAYISPYALDHPGVEDQAIHIEPLVAEAMRLLHFLGDEYNYANALLTLAHVYLYGEYSIPHRFDRAFRFYHRLADEAGHPTAQFMVGWFYATGFGFDTNVWDSADYSRTAPPAALPVPQVTTDGDTVTLRRPLFPYGPRHHPQRSPSRAVLYYTFAALQGHLPAKMAVAYRYHTGTGAPAHCDVALSNYHHVARRAIKHLLAGPPGGRHLPLEYPRLSDADAGVYGIQPEDNGHDRRPRDPSMLADVLEYWRYRADRGDLKAELTLAQIHYAGTATTEPNYPLALRYLRSIVTELEVTDPKAYAGPRYVDPTHQTPGTPWPESFLEALNGHSFAYEDLLAGIAAASLGQMYVRGEGVRPSNETAYYWFQRGAERASSNAMYWLGIFYRDGTLVPRNKELAMTWFDQAAQRGDVASFTEIGLRYKELKHYTHAFNYFTVAARFSHPLGMYHLAQLYRSGRGTPASCENAVPLFKKVAEQANWLYTPLVPSRHAQTQPFDPNDLTNSLVRYALAAEMGYEVAQANLAWLLELTGSTPESHALVLNRLAPQLALSSWTRAANQGNVDGLIKVGDYYFDGRGVPRNLKRAAAAYQLAAENHLNPIAMWNLGWMHENGLGVPRDFYMAKRCYERAASTYPKGSLPVTLSLIRLTVRYYWAWLHGEDVGTGSFLFGSHDEVREDAPPPLDDGKGEYLADEAGDPANPQAAAIPGTDDPTAVTQPLERPRIPTQNTPWRDPFGHVELNRPYYPPADVIEEAQAHHRRRTQERLDDPMGAFEHDPDGRFETDGTLDYDEDSWLENLVILGLCALVGWMMYVRQNRFALGPNDPGAPLPPPQQQPRDGPRAGMHEHLRDEIRARMGNPGAIRAQEWRALARQLDDGRPNHPRTQPPTPTTSVPPTPTTDAAGLESPVIPAAISSLRPRDLGTLRHRPTFSHDENDDGTAFEAEYIMPRVPSTNSSMDGYESEVETEAISPPPVETTTAAEVASDSMEHTSADPAPIVEGCPTIQAEEEGGAVQEEDSVHIPGPAARSPPPLPPAASSDESTSDL